MSKHINEAIENIVAADNSVECRNLEMEARTKAEEYTKATRVYLEQLLANKALIATREIEGLFDKTSDEQQSRIISIIADAMEYAMVRQSDAIKNTGESMEVRLGWTLISALK